MRHRRRTDQSLDTDEKVQPIGVELPHYIKDAVVTGAKYGSRGHQLHRGDVLFAIPMPMPSQKAALRLRHGLLLFM